ncbi:hypothetical protein CsSME_00034166 [Camellia sinensis var. sinensis]
MLGRNAMGKGEIQYESLSRFFSLADIQSATNNFDDQMVIGIGRFGKVYKGFIDNGSTTAAIKRLNPESNQGAVRFGLRSRCFPSSGTLILSLLLGTAVTAMR